MGQRQKDHRVLNVYGSGEIETVDNAIDTAITHHGAENESDALRRICAAYTGYDATE